MPVNEVSRQEGVFLDSKNSSSPLFINYSGLIRSKEMPKKRFLLEYRSWLTFSYVYFGAILLEAENLRGI